MKNERHQQRVSRRQVVQVIALSLVMLVVSGPARSGEFRAPSEPSNSSFKVIEAVGDRLDVRLNIRSRYETLENFTVRNYAAGKDDVLLLRTRLSFDYRWSGVAHGLVELQDARYWLNRLSRSDFGQSSSYFDELDLRQAYVEWKKLGQSRFGLKLGRQILVYGDRRVFAPAEWGNVGNYWWDAAKVSFGGARMQADFFYARRVLSEMKDWNFDHHPYHVAGAYARVLQLPVSLDAFYVAKGDWSGGVRGEIGPGDEQRHTWGIFSERRIADGWDYGLFGAAQVGRFGHDDIQAFGFIGRAGYTFRTAWKPRIGCELNYASGDGDPNDGVNETFDGLFGAMDVPYGWMNVVCWKNLADWAVIASVQPAKTVTLTVEYHGFRLARARDAWYWTSGKPERRDNTGRAGRDLGHELDVIARWPVRKDIELLVGGARFFAGDFLSHTPGGSRDATWTFAQLTCSR